MQDIISRMLLQMVDFYQGNPALVAHFIKVYTYARIIGLAEKLPSQTQHILEMAAICHDIAIPHCIKTYGQDTGHLQEKESEHILLPFLKTFDLPKEMEDRILFLVSHHHTYTAVDGMDWQILLEADFLVNADESHHNRASIDAMDKNVFKTTTGKHLLNSIYRNV